MIPLNGHPIYCFGKPLKKSLGQASGVDFLVAESAKLGLQLIAI
jgi:hypothetical protein